MGLTNKTEQRLKKMPLIESFVTKSKDGKYLIQRTVITNIKPVAYYKAVMRSGEHKELQQFFLQQGEELVS